MSAPTDFASIGGNESGESVEQRGFARAVWPDDAKYFASFDGKRNISNGALIAVALAELGYLDYWVGFRMAGQTRLLPSRSFRSIAFEVSSMRNRLEESRALRSTWTERTV
jgi:hypothetical protein